MRYTNINTNKPQSEHVRWYWRATAALSSCLILGGFLVLPATFDSNPQLRVSSLSVGIFGSLLLTIGFCLTALVCLVSRDKTWSLENVLLRAALASLIGFLNVLYCFAISTRFEWTVPAMVTTGGSAMVVAIYLSIYFLSQRQVNRPIKKSSSRVDLMRQPSIGSNATSYHTPGYFSNHVANMYPVAAARPAPSIVATTPEEEALNEDELQRQHMSVLLHKPEPYVSPSGSPFNRIEFNVEDAETPVNGYYAPVGAASSSRSLEDPAWRSRNNSWVTNDSRRASVTREERRREIESGR